MWVFLGSECFFFGTLIATYLAYKGKSVVGPEPHQILDIPVTTISTFDLLMSSLLMVLALAAVQRGDRRQARLWLFGTAFFGLIFLGFQVYEFIAFAQRGLTLQQNLFGSTFFVLTGLHGVHVTIGVLWLLSLWVLDLRGRLAVADAVKVEIAGARAASLASALVLTGVTALEVGMIYVRQLAPIIVPLLLAMSAAKFALVALFFMHLRYEPRALAFLFVGPLILAAGLVVALMTLTGAFLVFGR